MALLHVLQDNAVVLSLHSHAATVPELCKPNYMTAEHTAEMAEKISLMKW